MPIYELHCQSCNTTFERAESIQAHDEHMKKHDVPCPRCGSTRVEAQLGLVEVKTSKKS